jgi:hypothetical protein
VVLNLVNNAIDACSRGGEVAVRTREHDGFVEITVSDDGEGISDENMSKIFDPFFTTKPVGKGTGLGLSISYRIIMEHRGTISVRRNDTAGVTFLIRIPVDARGPQDHHRGGHMRKPERQIIPYRAKVVEPISLLPYEERSAGSRPAATTCSASARTRSTSTSSPTAAPAPSRSSSSAA